MYFNYYIDKLFTIFKKRNTRIYKLLALYRAIRTI